MQAFYVNLDRHPERRAYIEAQLERAGISAERVAGVDGKKVPPDLAHFYELESTSRYALRANQIGCHAANLKVMQIILERDLDYALVLQDDATLPPNLKSILDEVVDALPAEWDLIRLCRPSKAAVRPLRKLSDGRQFVRYSRIPLGNAGALVSRSGARKLLAPRKVRNPSDKEIAQSWLLDLDVYGVEPNPIYQERVALPSTIGRDRGGLNRYQRMLTAPAKLRHNISKLGFVWWSRCHAENLVSRLTRARRTANRNPSAHVKGSNA